MRLREIDETWKALRRLSQQRHCLVVTATQANALAYGDGSKLLTRKNFSGRKTKLAHVNGMIGIVRNEQEIDTGRCRVNWIVRRSQHFNEHRACRVAGCYAIASPAMKSVM